jgi:hypothetical protein
MRIVESPASEVRPDEQDGLGSGGAKAEFIASGDANHLVGRAVRATEHQRALSALIRHCPRVPTGQAAGNGSASQPSSSLS